MATVGDVLINVRANTTEATAGLRNAAGALRQVRADMAQAESAFQAGAISLEDYQVAQRVAGRETLGLAVQNHQLTRSFGYVAASMVGVNSGMTRLGVLFSTMFTSNAVVLGILAVATAIGVVAKVIGTITQGAREAHKALDDLIKKYADLGRQMVDPLQAQRAEEARLTAEQQRLRRIELQAAEPGGAFRHPLQWMWATAHLPEAEKRLAEVNTALKAIRVTLKETATDKSAEAFSSLLDDVKAFGQAIAQGIVAPDMVTRATKLAEALKAIYENLSKPLEERVAAWKAFRDLLGDIGDRLGRSPIAPISGTGPGGVRLVTPRHVEPRGIPTGDLTTRNQEMYEAWQQWGENAGRAFTGAFADLLTGGNFARVLTNLFRQIFSTAIEAAFRGVFEGIGRSFGETIGGLIINLIPFALSGTSGTAIGGGGNVTRGGGGGPSLNLVVNVPTAPNGLILARDAQWQAALRESLLVARSGGFR